MTTPDYDGDSSVHRVTWFARDPGGGTAYQQPERTAHPGEPLPETGCTTDHAGGPCDCTVLDANQAVTRSCYACPSCDGETRYQSMSGGREWYCPDCGTDGYYPEGEAPRRAQMLADGRFDELRAEMREELARRAGETRTVLDATPEHTNPDPARLAQIREQAIARGDDWTAGHPELASENGVTR